jgi:hypothetical protein
MSGTVYKLKDSIIWILLLSAEAVVNMDIFEDYSVVYTLPELTSFAQSGPITINGPQRAILVLPETILPTELLDRIITKSNLGTYREILSIIPPGSVTLTITDLINLTEVAIIKAAEYEVRVTNT